MTCDEIEIETGMLHQTVSPRLLELREYKRVIKWIGITRLTRTGTPAEVYVHCRPEDAEPALNRQFSRREIAALYALVQLAVADPSMIPAHRNELDTLQRKLAIRLNRRG